MSVTDKYAPLSKDETIAGLKAEIERLTADNHKLMLWNEQLQAELDIARCALEGK